MSITYLDFEHINLKEDNVKAEAIINLSRNIPKNNYNKCAISKLDLDVGDNWYFQRVPLKQPQTYKNSSTYIDAYNMKDSSNNYIYNHDNGYFETKYKFCVVKKSGGNLVFTEYPILYKSTEVNYNNNIPYKSTSTPGDYIYDNFNEYFVSYNANNFLSSINECIRVILTKEFTLTNNQYINLLPQFFTDDKKLTYSYFSYSGNNDMQNAFPSSLPLLVSFPEEVDAGVYPDNVKHPSPTLFCIGFNKLVNNLLYHGLVSKKYDTTYTSLNNDYYFLKLDQTLEVALSIPDINDNSKRYNISSQYVNEFYDMGDIKILTIQGSLPVAPLYTITKMKDYLLDNNNSKESDVQSDIMFKMSINNNTLVPTRFIFSQPSITNNYSSLVGGLNNTNYYIHISYIDKYGNNYDCMLSQGDKIFLSVACFD